MTARRPDPLRKSGKVSNTMEPQNKNQLVRVPFRGGELLALGGEYANPGDRPVPLRPACDRLHVTVQSQLTKLKDKPWATITMIVTVAEDGKVREMACIPLRALAMWLASINPSKVAPELRDMLMAYQCEAADVLYRHFMPSAPANDVTHATVAGLARGFAQLSETLNILAIGQQQQAAEIAAIKAEVSAFHREHSHAKDVAAIGAVSAAERIKKPIVLLARRKARFLGGKAAEPSYNRKMHLRVREACDGFSGPWERLPRAMLGKAETCIQNIEREVFADARMAERHGYTPDQPGLFERKTATN